MSRGHGKVQRAILSALAPPGQRKTIPELAAGIGVHVESIRRAVGKLEHEGYVKTRRVQAPQDIHEVRESAWDPDEPEAPAIFFVRDYRRGGAAVEVCLSVGALNAADEHAHGDDR